MKCFYHTDLDGKCAGAIVYQWMQTKPFLGDCSIEMIGIDYKDAIDIKTISPNEKLWIVDFSFKPEIMEEVLKITKNITWIDHHKTAMEYQYSIELDGVREVGLSGCELTWGYLHPIDPMPPIVEMLGRYDVWDFSKYGEILNMLQAGIKLERNDPTDQNWEIWLFAPTAEHILQDIIDAGKVALKFRQNRYADLIKALAFTTEFEGYKAIACNVALTSSQLFDSAKGDFDLMMPFSFDGENWTVSIYTKKDNIDVSGLAKKHGGGGHKQAAGFVTNTLPFRRK